MSALLRVHAWLESEGGVKRAGSDRRWEGPRQVLGRQRVLERLLNVAAAQLPPCKLFAAAGLADANTQLAVWEQVDNEEAWGRIIAKADAAHSAGGVGASA